MEQPLSDPPPKAEDDETRRRAEETPPSGTDQERQPEEPRSLFADLDLDALGAINIESASAAPPPPPAAQPARHDETAPPPIVVAAPPIASSSPTESVIGDRRTEEPGTEVEAVAELPDDSEEPVADLSELEAVVAPVRDRPKGPRKSKRSPLVIAAAYLVLLVVIAALGFVGYDLFRQYASPPPVATALAPPASPSVSAAGEAAAEMSPADSPAASEPEPATETTVPSPPAAEPVGPAPSLADGLSEEARAEAEALQRAILLAPGETPGAEAAMPVEPAPPAEPAAAPVPPPVDAAKTEAFRAAMTAARQAMAERKLAAATERLAAAEVEVQTPDERVEFDRVAQLAAYLEQFWQAVRTAIAALRPADELPVQNSRVLVVEVAGEQLTVRTAAKNYTFTPANMHHNLVLALAERGLAQSPDRDLLLGTYLAFAPGGDRAEARQLWQRASAAGADVASLVPELELPPPANATAAASGAHSAAQGRAAPPEDEAALEAATAAWRDKLAADYAAAEKPGGKTRLVRKLLAAGKEADLEAVARYAALREALALAGEAGEPALATQAIRELSEAFLVDEPRLKTDALATLVDHARGAADHRLIAQQALELLKAAAVGSGEDAERLVGIAEAAAQKSGSRTLLEQARGARAQLTPSDPAP